MNEIRGVVIGKNFMVILIKKWQYNKINIDFSNHVPIVQGWLFGLDQLYMALRMRFECFSSRYYLSFDISNKQSIILENLYCGCNIFFDVPAVETYLLKTHISWLYPYFFLSVLQGIDIIWIEYLALHSCDWMEATEMNFLTTICGCNKYWWL